MTKDVVAEVSVLLQEAGLELHLDSGRLVCRGRRENYSDQLRELVNTHREKLVRYLASPLPQQQEPDAPTFPAEAWPMALAAAEAAIDQAEQDQRLTDVQQRVLAHYRTVANKLFQERDPLLLGLADDVNHQMRAIWNLGEQETTISSLATTVSPSPLLQEANP